jgi:hypothetical protein
MQARGARGDARVPQLSCNRVAKREQACVRQALPRHASGKRAIAFLAQSATALVVIAGCSFDESAIAAAGTPNARPGNASDDVGQLAGRAAPAAGNGASSDASTTEDDSSAATGGSSMGGSGGISGSVAPEAGSDASGPDAGGPGCVQELPACVCGHTRLATPDDPCAALDCPLEQCAPDDQCALKRFDRSVYYVCDDARSQEDALARCAAISGMHLVYIGGSEEDAFLSANVSGKVWIGAVQAEEDVWTWLDGTEFYDDGEESDDAYVNWDESVDEPNGLGVGGGSVTCAILWSETGAWADTNCPALNGYVCELEL